MQLPSGLGPVYLPDARGALAPASELAYNDAPWLTGAGGADVAPAAAAAALGVATADSGAAGDGAAANVLAQVGGRGGRGAKGRTTQHKVAPAQHGRRACCLGPTCTGV